MTRPMSERFRLDELVHLDDGWARLPIAGEELFRLVAGGFGATPWIVEDQLSEIEGIPGMAVESMVVPGPAQAEEPDPRQLTLPIEARHALGAT